MILNADAAALEWRVVAHLSKDPIAIREITNGEDAHTNNQKAFDLPSRLIAKKFLFRAIYKGTAYAYSIDNDFKHIGNEKFWAKVIDKFYDKYQGIFKYHNELIQTATREGKIVSETGRDYFFEPRKRRGEDQWPINDIVNYPVQGLGGDLMVIARLSANTRLKKDFDVSKWKWINTVHDSLVLDVDNDRETWYNIALVIKEVFKDIPANYEKLFNKPFNVPMAGEITIGNNWLWQHKLM